MTKKNSQKKPRNLQKKTPPRLRRKSKRVKSGITMPGGLSECAQKYALAISDPWHPGADGACIPRHPSRPSFKVRVFTRTTVTIGTGLIGICYFIPCVANNIPTVVYTTKDFAGTTVFAGINNIAATTGIASANNNGPFGAGSFIYSGASMSVPPSVSARMVSAGISWQYTGTVANMGGLSYAISHPNHENTNLLSSGTLTGMAECSITRVDNKKNWLVTSSTNDDECNYPLVIDGTVPGYPDVCYPYSNGQTFNTTDNTVGGAPLCISFTGVAGSTFEVETCCHIEYIGSATQYALSPSHGDTVGFETISAASALVPSLRVSRPSASTLSLMSKAIGYVVQTLKPAAPIAAGLVGYKYGGARLGNALHAATGQLMLTNG